MKIHAKKCVVSVRSLIRQLANHRLASLLTNYWACLALPIFYCELLGGLHKAIFAMYVGHLNKYVCTLHVRICIIH